VITVLHTIFIWGPLVSNEKEREEIVQMLADFERDHVWPTAWVINKVRAEWRNSGVSTSISPMEQ
jgi:hypothetical protein